MAKKEKKKNSKAKKDETVVILPGIHNECLGLLAEAHDHFYQYGEEEQSHLNQRERIMYASEMSRITIRLSCVMAWLMTRKAVFSGKLTELEAASKYRLDCRDVCLNQHVKAESILPKKVVALLDKSFELYQRVARLDDLADKKE
jgi:regulator of CtrA degradation